MNRVHQFVLVGSTILGSWLGMQTVHEAGHVLGAWLTGGSVAQVVLDPLSISRTDLAVNPHPLVVVWFGPLFGITAPLIVWCIATAARVPWSFVLRFFAGFCLLANGLYIGFGSFARIGDCGEMLLHGAELWQLWLFGAATAPIGLWLWHRQGAHFGLGSAKTQVSIGAAYGALAASLALLGLGLAFKGE